MRKNKRFLCLIAVLMLTLQFTACGGSAKNECQNVLDEFEYACNELDVDAMLRCINPEIADPIRIGLALYTHITDQDTEDIVDDIGSVLISSIGEMNIDAEELFQSMELEIKKLEVKGKNAVAYVDINFETLGIEVEKYGEFDLKKVEDTWYIESFAFTENSYE